MYIYIDTHTYIQTERWYCQNQRWMQPTKAGKLAARTGKFKEEETWGKGCFKRLEQEDLGKPATNTCLISAD